MAGFTPADHYGSFVLAGGSSASPAGVELMPFAGPGSMYSAPILKLIFSAPTCRWHHRTMALKNLLSSLADTKTMEPGGRAESVSKHKPVSLQSMI